MMISNKKNRSAFTLIEVIIVMVVLAIIAAVAVPMFSSAGSVQLSSAADVIASDLEYTKSMAISTGMNHSIVFNTSAESYQINDSTSTVISHPVNVGSNYIVNFAADGRLDKVGIVSTTLVSDTVTFDCLGSPSGVGGQINLIADGSTMTVRIEPVTGYITIE